MSLDSNNSVHVYVVPDMTCDHCKRRIVEGLASVPGVAMVDVDLSLKRVSVTGGESGTVADAILDAGYTVADSPGNG